MKSLAQKLLVVMILVILIIVVALGVFVYNKFYKTSKKTLHVNIPDFNEQGFNISPRKDKMVLKDDLKTLIAKVGQLIELPVDELPNIATVTDVSKLKDQPFFAHARNGDRVLIYSKAKRAIIYRPSANKIIEAASVDVELNETKEASASASEAPSTEGTESASRKKMIFQEK